MNIELRKISLSDTSNIVKWRNSSEVKKNLYSQEDVTEEQHINYFHKYVETGRIAQFIIVVNGVDCGTIFLKNIDQEKREAEFGIFIGEAEYRGKGIGRIATAKIVDYGFNVLNLSIIYLSVLKDNISAIKSYKKVGFTETRTILEGYSRDGAFFDVVEMKIQNIKLVKRG